MPPGTPDEPTPSGPPPATETFHTTEPKDIEKIEPSQANMDPAFRGIVLPWDIWSVIPEFVYHDDENKRDLFNFCLVSKAVRSLATPYLYRCVIISPVNCPATTWIRKNAFPLLERPSRLVRRLLGNRNFEARSLVRELRIESRFDVEGGTAMKATKKGVLRFISQECLAQLVTRLPNLERIRIEFPLPLTDKFADNLDNHPNKIDIQVVWTRTYDRSIPRRVVPSISAVCAMTGSPGVSDELHSFLVSCNNLRSFSLQPITQSFLSSERLCDPNADPERQGWMSSHFVSMHFHVSYGYNPWNLWEDQSPWSSLLSLSIDSTMEEFSGLLGAMSGHTPLLKNLKIAFHTQTPSIKAVEQFVSSFNTLESFECIGWCSLRALSKHTRLVDLKMHAGKYAAYENGWQELSRLNIGDLEQLSVDCPDLRWLELDAQLEDGELPYDAIITLATRFDRLYSLTLHFGMLLLAPLKSGRLILDSSDVKDIGDVFFNNKRRESNGSSSLSSFQKLVLDVRCESFVESPEELFEGTFELRPPADPTQNHRVTLLAPESHEVDQRAGVDDDQRFSVSARAWDPED